MSALMRWHPVPCTPPWSLADVAFFCCVCANNTGSACISPGRYQILSFPHAVMVFFFSPKREIHLDNKNFSNFCAACLYDGGGKGSWAQEGGGVFMVVSGYLMFSLRAHPGLFPQTWYSLFTPLAPSWCPVGFTSPALSRSPC